MNVRMYCISLAVTSLMALSTIATPTQAQEETENDMWKQIDDFVEEEFADFSVSDAVKFYGDFDGDKQQDALAFIYYSGEGNSTSLSVALFKGENGKLKFLRYVPEVYGQQPGDVKFSKGMITLRTTVPKKSDARCCPSGTKRFRIKVP